MDITTVLTAFTTLFVIMDPPGLVPIFIALTQGLSPRKRRSIAIRAVIVAGCLMCAFLLLGEALLGFVGISMPAFRIAGGILLFITALEMLFQKRQKRKQDNAEQQLSDADDDQSDPSVFPLAVPLIVGPGSIATVILLSGQAQTNIDLLLIISIVFAVLLINYILFRMAPKLEQALGNNGINILTRVLGMLLAALSTQFVLDGIKQSFGL